MNWRLRYKDAKVPCYDCQERYEGCHAKCEKYALYAKQNELKREAALMRRDINDYTRDSINRMKRKRERRR